MSVNNETEKILKKLNIAYVDAMNKEKELTAKCLHEQMDATDLAFMQKFPQLKDKNVTLMDVYSEDTENLTEDEAKEVVAWLESNELNEVRQNVLNDYKAELEDLRIKLANAEDKLINFMSNNTNELLTKLIIDFSKNEEKDLSTLYRKKLLARTISTYLTATI